MSITLIVASCLAGCANFDNRRKVIVRTPDGKTVRVYADTLEQKRALNREVQEMKEGTKDLVITKEEQAKSGN